MMVAKVKIVKMNQLTPLKCLLTSVACQHHQPGLRVAFPAAELGTPGVQGCLTVTALADRHTGLPCWKPQPYQ